MTFPVYIHLWGLRLHPHPILELAGYTLGFQLYLRQRRKAQISVDQNIWLITGCIFGAVAGALILAWNESAPTAWANFRDLRTLLAGKTIVGGLLGGWAGVEIAKKKLGITRSTGDAFVFPLSVGIAVGRIGCFLTGLEDHTYGIRTTLPWGVNFGDGVYRHPTQLYESAFLLTFAGVLLLAPRHKWPEGRLFRVWMLGYLTFRFAVEFIKPTWKPVGISPIQMACLAGAGVCLWQLVRGQGSGFRVQGVEG